MQRGRASPGTNNWQGERDMSALVICSSREHGNTRRLAQAIADELEAEVLEPDRASAAQIATCELVGFGSGIRFTRHYRELFELVRGLPAQPGKRAFVFSTSGVGILLWHWALDRQLRAKGFEIVGEHCCRGLDTMGLLRLIGGVNRGRPNAADLEQARRFARGLR
jgi:flavodoxin